jgi:hypothetical protein
MLGNITYFYYSFKQMETVRGLKSLVNLKTQEQYYYTAKSDLNLIETQFLPGFVPQFSDFVFVIGISNELLKLEYYSISAEDEYERLQDISKLSPTVYFYYSPKYEQTIGSKNAGKLGKLINLKTQK